MKQIFEQLWQQHGEENFIEILSEFLARKQNVTPEGTSYWALLLLPAEFDADIVIEAAYSCRQPDKYS